jgi:hypothetical protein
MKAQERSSVSPPTLEAHGPVVDHLVCAQAAHEGEASERAW